MVRQLSMRLVRLWGSKCVHTSAVASKAGKYKITPFGDYPLTYEQAQPPERIGVTKSWNVWNSCNLKDPWRNPKHTVIEDQFVRKFILGTWHKIWLSEVVLKRRHNNLLICGIICPQPMMSAVYFLKGYTEHLLSQLLKLNVTVQVQCVDSRKVIVHKFI